MENELEVQDSLTPAENSELEQTENAEVEDVDALKEKLTKAEELAKNQKIRAEKAEAEAKKLKVVQPQEKETPKNDLSLKDIRALQDVHDDDVDEVIEFAKFKGISIAEAKKLPAIQSLLSTKEEFRKTAQAANTGGGRKGTSKVTGEDLLEKFNQGQVPEKDEDIEKLIEARFTPKPRA